MSGAQEWIGTFGVGHHLGACYVVLHAASCDEARNKMFAMYGSKWAFVYPSREAAGVDRFVLEEVPFGTPNAAAHGEEEAP